MKSKQQIIFITGTDTGVGKTVLTGMLLHQLRQEGVHALGMKPFCSGDIADVKILRALQENELTVNQINPYFFPDPVAPIASRRKLKFTKQDVLKRIRTIAQKCEVLLVEGCGGLMVPLTPRFAVIDLIAELKCRVIVVAANKLGVMNHTLLTVSALQSRGVGMEKISVVLMEQKASDPSVATNETILRKWLSPIPILPIPYLGRNSSNPKVLQQNAQTTCPLIARLAGD